MKKFNAKKLLVGLLASANLWTIVATSTKRVKAPSVEPNPPSQTTNPPIVNPGQTLTKEEQLNKIKTMTLKVLEHNSAMDIEDITLLDFKNKKMTAYCTLKNDKTSTYVASFYLDSENNSSSLIKALSKADKIDLVESHYKDNVFINNFAVKYFYTSPEFDKENYELLNAYQNNSIETSIGVTCLEQRIYKFSYIVKNKKTNQVSKLDHQVIFAMPSWNKFSLMLEDGEFDNLYDYLLTKKAFTSHTQTTNFSNFAANYVKYCGSNSLDSTPLDQLSAKEKEEIAKQDILNLLEKKVVSKIGKNGLEDLQILTIGKLDDKSTSYYENYDLAALITYTKDGKKYFAKIHNNIIPFTPQSYLNLADYSDNTTKERNLYIKSFELEANDFAAQAFDKLYNGNLPQYDLCYTSKIQYIDNDSISKKYVKINCLYLCKNENGNYSYYNAVLRFERATETELQNYFDNNPTKNEYDYYFEKVKSDDYTHGTEVNYINKLETDTKNLKEELYAGVLNYLRSQEGRENAEILLIDYKRSPNYSIYDEFNLFVVYKHTQDGIEYINTAKASLPCKLECSSDVNKIINNLKNKNFCAFPFDYNPFRYNTYDEVLNACKPISNEALRYQEQIFNRIQETFHFSTYSNDIVAKYMSDVQIVSDYRNTYLSLSLVIIAKDKSTGKYSYYNFAPKYKYDQKEFESYVASNQGSTLLDFYFYKMENYKENKPALISEEWYDFNYEFSNFTDRFTRNIKNDNVKYLNVKQYLAAKHNITAIKPKKEDESQLTM